MSYRLPGGQKIGVPFNPSLLFEKFLNMKDHANTPEKKNDTFNRIPNDLKINGKNLEAYKLKVNHLNHLPVILENSGYKVKIKIFRNTSPLIVGMGRSNALENGMTFNRNWGFPIIPSSAIKGIVRNYILFYKKEEEAQAKKYLGDDNDENPSSGKVDFLNAYMLPTNESSYSVDILTNHFSEYYGGDEAPNDWFEPVPVKFLEIGKGKSFVFTIFGEDEKIIEKVTQWLEEALLVNGIGAKTAVGYGRFKFSKPETEELESKLKKEEDEHLLSSMSSFQKKVFFIKKSDKNEKDRLAGELFKEFDNLEEDEKKECALLLKEVWQQLNKWDGKPSDKQKKKIKKIKDFLNNI